MYEFLIEVVATEFIIGNREFSDTNNLIEDGTNS